MTADDDALWGETWGGMQDIGPVHRHNRQIIVDLIRPLGVRSVLDAGYRNGANLEAIQSQLGITDVMGIDLSENALNIARRRVRGQFTAVNLDDDKLDRAFDLVLTSQVIEHVVDNDGFLNKLRAMSGRYVIVATMQGRMRKSETHIGHGRNYTRRGLKDQMRRAGFKIEKVVVGIPVLFTDLSDAERVRRRQCEEPQVRPHRSLDRQRAVSALSSQLVTPRQRTDDRRERRLEPQRWMTPRVEPIDGA